MSARWEGDTRGEGVGDAASFADGAAELVAAMRAERWVAEDPDTHLLPHLRAVCESLPFELISASPNGDAYVVRVRWLGGDGSGVVREAVFALVGAMSETATYIRQRGESFEVVTGFVGGDSRFAPHGHTLRIEVER